MNLLLCLPNTDDFAEVLNYLQVSSAQVGEVVSVPFLAHHVDVLVVGEMTQQTAQHIGIALSGKRYHLALFAGFAQSWKAVIPVGMVVNVIREKSGENADFSNRTNQYINIFFELKKVFSAPKEIADKADVFSENGMAFVAQCAQVNQPFYQLRAIEKNVALNEANKELAKKNLNTTLIAILAVI